MAPVTRDGDALVVFSDGQDHWLSPLLKPGFRHVFVCVARDGYWIKVDPLTGTPLVEVQSGTDYDLETYFRGMGFQVVRAHVRQPGPVVGPFSMANCVGMTKAIIGLRAPLVFTPWQLYRRLARC